MEKERIENKMDLFSTKEAARRLGVSPPTLRHMAKKKRIGSFKVGGRLKFNQFVLDQYLMSVFEPQQ
jgi:excisionase family DNA binding protein